LRTQFLCAASAALCSFWGQRSVPHTMPLSSGQSSCKTTSGAISPGCLPGGHLLGPLLGSPKVPGVAGKLKKDAMSGGTPLSPYPLCSLSEAAVPGRNLALSHNDKIPCQCPNSLSSLLTQDLLPNKPLASISSSQSLYSGSPR
jgi:hypothetical protein